MRPSSISLLLALVTFLQGVSTAPIPFSPRVARSVAVSTLNARSGMAAPRFMAYGNNEGGDWGPPSAANLTGYNIYALSFFQSDGPHDKAVEWEQYTPEARTALKAEYAQADIKLFVSVFGGQDWPTTNNVDPTKVATNLANWVTTYSIDGVDIDYEDDTAMNKGDGSAEKWIITFTSALRAALPADVLLAHAPQAPWFSPQWTGGGYLAIDKEVGSMIDWFTVQVYNQGDLYTSCESIVSSSGGSWPGTSILEIAANGVPLDKLIIGKPSAPGLTGAGYVAPDILAECVQQAAAKGWNGGITGWEYPQADSAWIQTVRGSAFPMGGTDVTSPGRRSDVDGE